MGSGGGAGTIVRKLVLDADHAAVTASPTSATAFEAACRADIARILGCEREQQVTIIRSLAGGSSLQVQFGVDGLRPEMMAVQEFVEKALGAQAAGTVALIVVNTEDKTSWPGWSNPSPDITIPSICVGKSDGERLLLAAAAAGDGTLRFAYDLPGEQRAAVAASFEQADRCGGLRVSSFPKDKNLPMHGLF